MTAVRCPQCQAVLNILPEQRGQTIVCGQCGNSFHLAIPATEIQTPNLRLDAAPPVDLPLPLAVEESIKKPATDLPVARPARRAEQPAVSGSAAFRREMERFSEDRLPFLDEFPLEPIPEQVPIEADQLGRPVASLLLKGDKRVLGITAGVGMMFLALSCLAMIPIGFLAAGPPKKGEDLGGMASVLIYVPIFAGIGIWLVLIKKWTPPRSLWVCPGGLIWQWGSRVGFRRWHEIEDFSVSGATGRPLFWLTPAEGTDFVLSAGQGPTVVPVADYIELKASAALLPVMLGRFLANEKLKFDRLSMDRDGIRARGQVCLWSEIGGTRLDGTAFLVTDRGRQELVRLRTKDVSFPMVAQAIVRIVTEEGLHR